MSDEFETIMTEYPICPHCGTEDDTLVDVPLAERALREDGESDIYSCGACGKSYLCTLHLQCAHSTSVPVEQPKMEKKKDKPRIQIHDWYIQNQVNSEEGPWSQLIGRVFEHPTVGSYEGGKMIHTSMLLAIDFKAGIAETFNTYYLLGDPHVG